MLQLTKYMEFSPDKYLQTKGYIFYGTAKKLSLRIGDTFEVDGENTYQVSKYIRRRSDRKRHFAGYECILIGGTSEGEHDDKTEKQTRKVGE